MSQLRRLVPSLNTLHSFEAAARCGGFVRAASEMGLSAPAVSRNIARLEEHLGITLFDRTATGARLTEAGRRLYAALHLGFGQIETAILDLHRDTAVARPVVLSVSSAFATHWFIPRLAQFRTDFPGVEIRFHLIGGLIGGDLGDADIAMRFDPPAAEGLHRQYLLPEMVIPVVAPGFRGDRPALAAPGVIDLRGAEPDWDMLLGRLPGDAPGESLLELRL